MTDLAEVLNDVLISGVGGAPNITDAVIELAYTTKRVAVAIADEAAAGTDAAGGRVSCLTEAVMGVTAGLVRIAESISELAEAVREHRAE